MEYIDQAKRINWKQLLSAAEEVMGFIQTRSALREFPLEQFKPILPSEIDILPADEEVMWFDDEEDYEEPQPQPPKQKLSLDRTPKRNLVLKRN
jgi:hypothetical protein